MLDPTHNRTAALIDAMKQIAKGYRLNDAGQVHKLSPQHQQAIARDCLIRVGIEWQDATSDRLDAEG